MVAIFQESMKARYYHEFNSEEHESWASAPETYIYVSNDYGENWSDPIVLNANAEGENYDPELEGMIPAYWYIAENIEKIDDEWGRIHLMFYNQKDYGSSLLANSRPTGGEIMYTSMNIMFGETDVSVDQKTTPRPAAVLHGNYPNPFNPETTITYSLSSPSKVTLQIYNSKGQLVKTLVDGKIENGNRSVSWDGNDNRGRETGSGVYFLKLTADKHSEFTKMLLVR